MNKLDKQYTDLLQDILDNGVKKQDRTGTGTISVFGRQIRHDMKDGFPLLTTKKMPFKTIVTELLWFLRGDTNIKYLVDNNCHIWDGDAYKNYMKKGANNELERGNRLDYLIESFDVNGRSTRMYTPEEFINKIKTDDKFAKKWGELGPIYGKQWRKWTKYEGREEIDYNEGRDDFRYYPKTIDQIQNLINDLKTNPDSRRLMVNAWNVGELDQMVLPPCHYGFQVYTRELNLEERCEIKSKKEKTRNTYEQSIDTFGKQEVVKWMDEDNIPTRAISLMWNQRSVDTFLGLPFNIASYGLLLEIIAKEVNMVPDQLIGNLGDVHLYSNHLDAAKEQIGRELTHNEQIAIYSELGLTESQESRDERFINKEKFEPNIPKRTREPFPLPKVWINTEFWAKNCGHENDKSYKDVEITDFNLDGYESHSAIKAPLSN